MSTTTINKKIKSRRPAAMSVGTGSSGMEVRQNVALYQSKPLIKSKNIPKVHALFKAGDLLIKSMERNVEAAYNDATKGMSKNDKAAMVYFLRNAVDHIAEKVGVTEREVLLQTQRENKRFIDNLKTEAESARAEHIASGKLLPSSAFQEKLGISKQAISKAIKENRMFAVLGPSGENFYPAFFSEEKYDRRNLERVCKALGTLPGGSKWQFFTTAKGSLDGRTPLEALAMGQVDAVMVSAAGFVER